MQGFVLNQTQDLWSSSLDCQPHITVLPFQMKVATFWWNQFFSSSQDYFQHENQICCSKLEQLCQMGMVQGKEHSGCQIPFSPICCIFMVAPRSRIDSEAKSCNMLILSHITQLQLVPEKQDKSNVVEGLERNQCNTTEMTFVSTLSMSISPIPAPKTSD